MEYNQYSTATPSPITPPPLLLAFGPEPNQLGQRASLSLILPSLRRRRPLAASAASAAASIPPAEAAAVRRSEYQTNSFIGERRGELRDDGTLVHT